MEAAEAKFPQPYFVLEEVRLKAKEAVIVTTKRASH